VRLPGCFCCYQPPENAPAVSPPPAARNRQVTFAALVNPVKINEQVIERWAEIMRAVPDSRLVLQAGVFADPTVQDSWRGLFAHHGIQPAQLVLLQNMSLLDHLRVYHDVDIALDTFPWSSHTTACHALWMGVPVVTLTGDRHAGRMVTSVLSAIGHPELATSSGPDYVRLAVDLARDTNRLAKLRGSLRQRMAGSPICDAPAFTQHLEKVSRELWQKWCEEQNEKRRAN
jgi:predicted O-linked N-acetylglucosamine transferase (SPINDLY family)